MNRRMLRFLQYCFPGVLAAQSAMAHEIGSLHEHNLVNDVLHSLLQPAHILILLGLALVIYLVLTRSAHK